ncbi:efflux RND transporter periplasmic adaptor subunit [Sphingobacterium suaedae]|uniref:Efflux RND transporter periplasmic adaptor subunit n=1 Tax=Sphingobacterium suaedae TaxID=1686402 RepID=A0ABW5KFD3_9SPHI
MKGFNYIFTVLSCTLLWTACGPSHSEGDGHNHSGKERVEQEGKESHVQEEEESTVTSLTAEQMAAVDIRFGNIERKNLTATIKANGVLSVPNHNKANVTPLYGGVVKTLRVQLGDQVRRGQVVATVANPQFIQVQEEYLTVNSRIVLAEQELQRQRELNEGNAGARKNLQAANTEVNALRTRKSSLQQQIQLMGIDPSSLANGNLRSTLSVVSPISGTVSNVFAKIGSYVDVAAPVVEVVDNSLIHLDLQVFEKDLPHIKVGQLVHFTLTNNPTTTYTAKVFTIGASFENESKSVAVHCAVVGDKQGLIDGMNTIGSVGLKDVLLDAVPNEAIVEADGKFYVFVQTGKEGEEHHDEEGHVHTDGEGHAHSHEDSKADSGRINFEKMEVTKGVSDMGYTAITPVRAIPVGARIVTKNAFFILAKMNNTGGHDHGH